MLVDEVTSGLDPEPTGEVLAAMERLARDGATVPVVAHGMGFARGVASTTAFMHGGRIHESGPSREIVDAPRTPGMAQFIRSDIK